MSDVLTDPEEPRTSRPIRPLIVGLEHFAARAGGLNRYVDGLLGGLETLGLAPVYLALGDAGQRASCRRVSVRPGGALFVRMARLRREVLRRSASCDLIDSHFALHGAAVLASPARRKPLVMHFQGPWAGESAAQGARGTVVRAKYLVERWVYRRASRIVVLSQAFRRVLVETYGVDPWRIVVIPPGVDLGHFVDGSKPLARRRLGLPDDDWVTVCVRRLVPRMGHDVLVDAWGRLVAGHPERSLRLLVAGTGPSDMMLERLADEAGAADSIEWMGRVDDTTLLDLYRAADVSVVPTVALEGFGLVVLESLAAGTPVIASDVGGLRDAMAGLPADLLVPPGDAKALADRLGDALTGGRPLPDRSSCRSHAERFAWPGVAARHVDLYREAIGPTPRTRRRVVFVGHTAQLSGGELALLRTLEVLQDSLDAHVILAADGPLVGRLQRAGISVEVLPLPDVARALPRRDVVLGRIPVWSVLAAAAYTARLARRLRRYSPDLVHANTLKAGVYGGIAARLAGVPMVWHVRDLIDLSYMPSFAVHMVRLLARHLPKRVIANSRTTLESLRLSNRQVVAIPSPIGAAAPPVDGANRPFTVAIVGRLTPWKGQDVFLRAFAEAFPTGPPRALVVGSALFGEHDFSDLLVALVDELGIADRVEFLGFRDDVEAVLSRVDVVVHSSLTPEPFGQVVVQGMAAGLPVIAADAGGPAEIVADGVNGLLCPPGDAAAYADALRRVATDQGLSSRLGAAGRTTAAAYTPEVVATQIIKVYDDVLAD